MRNVSFAAVALSALILFATAVDPQDEPSAPPIVLGNQPADVNSQSQEFKEIIGLYRAGEYEAVLKKAEAFFAKYGLTHESMGVLFYEAGSHYKLRQFDSAIDVYDKAVPLIEKLNNVQQRRYAFVYFMLGTLHGQQGRYDHAIELIQAGLRREPQNTYHQILLGELFRERGDRNRAVRHFNEILASTAPTAEEKTVVRIKLDRLTGAGAGSSVPPVQISRQPFYHGFSFAIVPLNYAPPDYLVRDICLLLESKWLVGCDVTPPLSLDESKIFDSKRKQFAGDRVLQELRAQYPASTRSHRLVVGLVDRDLFAPKINYVFSWQNRADGVGVVSTYRLFYNLAGFYEPEIIPVRRLGIQFISATGSMLGISRPTNPNCPTAYPADLREFQQKSSKLCESTIRERDELLKRRGGKPSQFGSQKIEEINRLYRAYYFD